MKSLRRQEINKNLYKARNNYIFSSSVCTLRIQVLIQVALWPKISISIEFKTTLKSKLLKNLAPLLAILTKPKIRSYLSPIYKGLSKNPRPINSLSGRRRMMKRCKGYKQEIQSETSQRNKQEIHLCIGIAPYY